MQYYFSKSGDNFHTIANQFQVPLNSLIEWNNQLTSIEQAGTRIRIPDTFDRLLLNPDGGVSKIVIGVGFLTQFDVLMRSK